MSSVCARQEAEEKRISDLNSLFSKHNQKVKEEKPAFVMDDYVDRLLPYADRWINNPRDYKFKTKSSNPTKQFIELVKFTFATYRVSPQLTRVWEKLIPEQHITRNPVPAWQRNRNQNNTPTRRFTTNTIKDNFCDWYICVAQGGSLYKAYAKNYLTKKEVHTFLNCPHDLVASQIMVYSTAMTFAPNEGVALRLAHSKLSEMPFTEFLKTVIYFFAKNTPKSVDEVNDLCDFVDARRREYAQITGHAPFTMNGFTLDSLRRKCEDWHYELRRIKAMGDYQWPGAPLPDETFETKGQHGSVVKWHFTQIKTSKALAAEGTAMRHCVYSYKDRCINNQVYIWSLSRQEEFDGAISRKVTIELRNDGSIVQARGVANRAMKPEERHMVARWADKNGLYLVC